MDLNEVKNSDLKDILNFLNPVNNSNLKSFIYDLCKSKVLEEKESKNLFLNLTKCDAEKLSTLDNFIEQLEFSNFLNDNKKLILELINDETFDANRIEYITDILDILRYNKVLKKNTKKEIFFTFVKDEEVNQSRKNYLMDIGNIIRHATFLEEDDKENFFFILYNNKEIDDDTRQYLTETLIPKLRTTEFLTEEKKRELFFQLFNEEVFTDKKIDENKIYSREKQNLIAIIDSITDINFLDKEKKEKLFLEIINNKKFTSIKIKFLEKIISRLSIPNNIIPGNMNKDYKKKIFNLIFSSIKNNEIYEEKIQNFKSKKLDNLIKYIIYMFSKFSQVESKLMAYYKLSDNDIKIFKSIIINESEEIKIQENNQVLVENNIESPKLV